MSERLNHNTERQTMTVQEAIKSGKPFRLPSWRNYTGKPYYALASEIMLLPVVAGDDSTTIRLNVFEILSEEWEIKCVGDQLEEKQ